MTARRASTAVKCSRCGAREGLNFVIVPMVPDAPGRALVYCQRCRRSSYGNDIDISIPLELMTPKLLANCYTLRLTGSDPTGAVRTVFGDGRPASRAFRQVEEALRRQPASGTEVWPEGDQQQVEAVEEDDADPA